MDCMKGYEENDVLVTATTNEILLVIILLSSYLPVFRPRNQQALYMIKDACTTSRISSLMSSDKILTTDHSRVIQTRVNHATLGPVPVCPLPQKLLQLQAHKAKRSQ